ncbi:MAG: carbohydrate-binding family 9-like protein [Saprospiraceae bacterium]|nr:carbohydrate-binding family 9-like protein [Saprospiraceae bacterium]
MKNFTIPVLILLLGCNGSLPNQNDMMVYQVQKITAAVEINANWDKDPWVNIDALSLRHYMGDEPEHIPQVQAKVAYDNQAIYVIFRVEDRYVRATRTKNQEAVFKDSCVEFFFSPEGHSEEGYFNLEMNCGGTMLFHHQKEPRKDHIDISTEDLAKIDVAHSLPEVVTPEIQAPTTWTVEYRIPFEVMAKYHDLQPPTAGSTWRSNFYKCADESSHPHWLTWAPIDFPRPDFHLPEFFGILKF